MATRAVEHSERTPFPANTLSCFNKNPYTYTERGRDALAAQTKRTCNVRRESCAAVGSFRTFRPFRTSSSSSSTSLTIRIRMYGTSAECGRVFLPRWPHVNRNNFNVHAGRPTPTPTPTPPRSHLHAREAQRKKLSMYLPFVLRSVCMCVASFLGEGVVKQRRCGWKIPKFNIHPFHPSLCVCVLLIT